MIVSNDMMHDSRVDRHAKALAMIGHEVIVLCLASGPYQISYERREHYAVVRYHSRGMLIARGILHADYEDGALSKFIRAARVGALIIPTRLGLCIKAFRTKAHMYYCNDLDTLDIGIMMKLTGKKLVYDSHELYAEMVPPGRRRRLSELFERLFVDFADVLITVNPFIAKELQRRYKIKKRIHVVLNCPETADQRARILARSKGVTVLCHGKLDADRGLENLVIASNYFDDQVRLLIRGEGKLEKELRRLASNRPNVSFEKNVPMSQVVQAASTADIGVIPYLATNLNQYYCSPNKLFEYIQAGLAVATSDLPFLRQVLSGNRIGVVFNPQDPVDMAKKINFLSQRKNLSRFKRNALAARQRFTWEKERARLYSAWRDLED